MFGKYIKEKRIELRLSVKTMAAQISMDASLLSRIENEQRLPLENKLGVLANALNLRPNDLLTKWLEDKMYKAIKNYPEVAHDVLLALETRAEYLTSKKSLNIQEIPPRIYSRLQEIDELRKIWLAKKPKQGLQINKLNKHFDIEYTYQSNRIEGNTLSLQETYLIINDGLTIAGKSIVEHLEAINHDEAIGFMNELVEGKIELIEYRLKEIHNLILKGIDRKNAGVYRTVPVRIGGSSHIPPEPFMLNKLMEDYFIHYANQKSKIHPVLFAAEMHERLVSIHPFIDGNGRTARLVMNMILLKNGYTTAIFKGNLTNRLEYYKALEAVQSDNNPIPFYELTLKVVKESLEEHLELV